MDVFRNVVSLEYEAQAAYDAQLYQEASVLHSRAVLAAQSSDSRLVAALCLRLGESLSAGKAMLDASTAYEAGFQSCSSATPPDVERLLTSLQSVGPYFYRFGRMDLPSHDDTAIAEALQATMTDLLLPARLLIECAEEYERQSSMYLALYTYKRVLEYLQLPDTLDLRVDILARLGSLAYRQCELTTIDATLSELVELWFSTTDSSKLCHVLTVLGGLYEVIGSVENAANIYREALKISITTNNSVAVGMARGRLTRLALQQRSAKRDRRATRPHDAQTADEHAALPATPETFGSRRLRNRVVAESLSMNQAQH